MYKGTLSCTPNHNTELPKVKEVAVKKLKSESFVKLRSSFFAFMCTFTMVIVYAIGASSEKEIDQFISESAIMAEFDHPNILKLLGVCFDTENGLPLIVLPFMANGDLRTYLTSKKQRITSTELPKVRSAVL